MQKKIMQLFKQRKIKKTYLAFVQGYLTCAEGEIKATIEGQTAVTRYKTMERRSGFSILEVMPITGRTNQIRIHFKKIGHPILGETRYAFRRDFTLKAKRLCLHARSLEFSHPVTNRPLRFISVIARDLQDFLGQHPKIDLKKFS